MRKRNFDKNSEGEKLKEEEKGEGEDWKEREEEREKVWKKEELFEFLLIKCLALKLLFVIPPTLPPMPIPLIPLNALAQKVLLSAFPLPFPILPFIPFIFLLFLISTKLQVKFC